MLKEAPTLKIRARDLDSSFTTFPGPVTRVSIYPYGRMVILSAGGGGGGVSKITL